jgi:hypothetical protein
VTFLVFFQNRSSQLPSLSAANFIMPLEKPELLPIERVVKPATPEKIQTRGSAGGKSF